MMTVLEYAEDVNKTVEFVLKKCQTLGINVSNEDDLLSDEDITMLDSELANEEESFDNDTTGLDDYEDIVDEIEGTTKIDIDNTISKQKLKKKNTNQISNKKDIKKDFANKKKQMYKNKEKLMSNKSNEDSNIVVYKEGMTIFITFIRH